MGEPDSLQRASRSAQILMGIVAGRLSKRRAQKGRMARGAESESSVRNKPALRVQISMRICVANMGCFEASGPRAMALMAAEGVLEAERSNNASDSKRGSGHGR